MGSSSRISSTSISKPNFETAPKFDSENSPDLKPRELRREPNKTCCPTKCLRKKNNANMDSNINKNVNNAIVHSVLHDAETQTNSTKNENKPEKLITKPADTGISNTEQNEVKDFTNTDYKAPPPDLQQPSSPIVKCHNTLPCAQQSQGNISAKSPETKIPESHPQKRVRDILSVCLDHNKAHRSNLEMLFKMCENDPDAIINAYQNQYLNGEKSADIEEYSEIKDTHGDILGDPKYFYLMVDASTSITQVPQDASTNMDSTILSQASQNSLRTELDLDQISLSNSFLPKQAKPQPPVDESKPSKDSDKVDTTKVSHVSHFPQLDSTSKSEEMKEAALAQKKKPSLSHKHIPQIQTEMNKNPTERKISIIFNETDNPKASLTKSVDESERIKGDSKDEGIKRTSSTITWSDFNNEDNNEDAKCEQDKKRVQETLSQIKKEQSEKNLKKESILNDIIKKEKSKPHLENKILQHLDESQSLLTDSKEELQPDDKAKCCGLIKRKKKTPEQTKKTVTVKTSEHLSNANKPSASISSESSSVEHSNVNRYRRRSSPVEHPVIEKHKKIKEYSSNL